MKRLRQQYSAKQSELNRSGASSDAMDWIFWDKMDELMAERPRALATSPSAGVDTSANGGLGTLPEPDEEGIYTVVLEESNPSSSNEPAEVVINTEEVGSSEQADCIPNSSHNNEPGDAQVFAEDTNFEIGNGACSKATSSAKQANSDPIGKNTKVPQKRKANPRPRGMSKKPKLETSSMEEMFEGFRQQMERDSMALNQTLMETTTAIISAIRDANQKK